MRRTSFFSFSINLRHVYRLPAAPTDNPPLTPLYDSLTTNIPHPIMAFTSYSFPPSSPLFPRAPVVQAYLESYAAHFNLTSHIRLNTHVLDVRRDTTDSKWAVQILGEGPGTDVQTLDFDFVIVANGHYRRPRYPTTPGLSKWIAEKKASHSAWYRRPSGSDIGQTTLVVGGGPSGQDISAELRSVASTVIHSMVGSEPEDNGNLKRRGRVVEFRGTDTGEVVFEDGSTETGVDHCILATGYEMSFPFLSDPKLIQTGVIPPSIPPLPSTLYNSSYHVFPLAKHIFPLMAPTLAFVGLPLRVAPFPIVEAQARTIAHVFGYPTSFDVTRESVDIVTRYEDLREELRESGMEVTELRIAQRWHTLKEYEQFDYRDDLYEFADEGDGYRDPSRKRIIVPEWEKMMYYNKDMLRRFWVKLVKNGEADDWVKGVGEGGPEEWVDLLQRMLKAAVEAEKNANASKL